jgi:hypothetical protein
LVFNPSAEETCIELSFEHRHYEKTDPSITCAPGLCHDAYDFLHHSGGRTSRNDHHHTHRDICDSHAAAAAADVTWLRGLLSQATSFLKKGHALRVSLFLAAGRSLPRKAG